jgi:hypothetical protein
MTAPPTYEIIVRIEWEYICPHLPSLNEGPKGIDYIGQALLPAQISIPGPQF